jgi:hypothetical protein
MESADHQLGDQDEILISRSQEVDYLLDSGYGYDSCNHLDNQLDCEKCSYFDFSCYRIYIVKKI